MTLLLRICDSVAPLVLILCKIYEKIYEKLIKSLSWFLHALKLKVTYGFMLHSQRSFQIETVIFPSGSWKRGLMGTVGALIVVPLNLQFSGAEEGIPINIYLTIINFFSLMEYFGCSFIIPSSLQSSYNIYILHLSQTGITPSHFYI